MKNQTVKLDGKTWEIEYVRRRDMPKDTYGDCDDKTRKMRVRVDVCGTTWLDTMIHEMLHASAFVPLSEQYVTETATAIAVAIVKSKRIKFVDDLSKPAEQK